MIHFAIPGDLDAPTGGYAYARRILAEWSATGVSAQVLSLSGGFPFPSEAALSETRAALGAVEDARGGLLIDGLAYGAFPLELAQEFGPRSTVLLHHPLCDETGLSKAKAAQMFETERAALAHARHVVVTSPVTAEAVRGRFGVPAERISVAIPGIERAAAAALNGDPPRLIAVGSLTRRKGYRELLAALDALRDLPWSCDIFGSPEHDPAEASRIAGMRRELGLVSRITLHGAAPPEQVWAAYAGADLFVTASHHEGYGMAAAEAAAHGLPIVATRGGALVETVPCAAFVPVGDVAALAEVLRDVLNDRAKRKEMGAASHLLARSMPDWVETARIVAEAMR